MKLDKIIKKKFVYSKNKNLIKSLYFLIQKYLKNKPKKSYSFGGWTCWKITFLRIKKKVLILILAVIIQFKDRIHTYLQRVI